MTNRNFKKGEFLLDYAGDLLTYEEGCAIEDNEYLYFFELRGKSYW